MTRFMCLNCHNTYDSSGNDCVCGQKLPGVSNTNITVEAVDPDSLEQESTIGSINETTSICTELTKVNPDFSYVNDVSNKGNSGNDQATYPSRVRATRGPSNPLMPMNSEKGLGKKWVVVNPGSLKRRHEMDSKDCNMAMQSDLPNMDIRSSIHQQTNTVYQKEIKNYGVVTTSIPVIPNKTYGRPQCSTVRGPIIIMPTNDFRTKSAFENVKKCTNIDSDNSENINRHNENHKGIIEYICNVCEKPLANKGNLKRHMLIHTGGTPFDREVSGKSFIDKGHLKKHAITQTDDKSYECVTCGKKFSKEGNLKCHEKTHQSE